MTGLARTSGPSAAVRRSGVQARLLHLYIVGVCLGAVGVGILAWLTDPHLDLLPLLLLSSMGILSFQLREPDVGSRIGFSFLSIILLASATIVGPLGAWIVGLLSVTFDRRAPRWSTTVFNMAMTAVVGAAGALAYSYVGGARADVASLEGALTITRSVGIPILVADVVGCLTNAVLLAGVIHFSTRVPFTVMVRRVLSGSGWAYVGYGVIGFLFVVLWFPADLGPFSAVLVLAPLLAARWAFIQYGDELRSHRRTLETLVTALGKKNRQRWSAVAAPRGSPSGWRRTSGSDRTRSGRSVRPGRSTRSVIWPSRHGPCGAPLRNSARRSCACSRDRVSSVHG